MNESPGLVCIPLPSPFLSAVGERGGRAGSPGLSVCLGKTRGRQALAGSISGTGLAEHGERPGIASGPALLCPRFHPLCGIPQKADFHKESFSIQ